MLERLRKKSFDDLWHGTHVAGVIASKGKYPGIAKGATVIAVKVLNKKGRGGINQIIKGIDYIMYHAKPNDVVNMSLGGPSLPFPVFNKSIKKAAKKNFFLRLQQVMKGLGMNTNTVPVVQFGKTKWIYAVSALKKPPLRTNDKYGALVFFSNYGKFDNVVVAPGTDIMSTYPPNTYASMSGTSMAAPHVAGVLLLSGKNYKIEKIYDFNLLKHTQ